MSWPLGFLSPGDSGEREVTVQLDAGLTPGDLVRASAEIFSVASPTDNAVVAADVAVAATSGLQMAIEANVQLDSTTTLYPDDGKEGIDIEL